MPRVPNRTVSLDSLPLFMRESSIGALIEETLRAAVNRDQVLGGASGGLVLDAAREIREFHGIEAPAEPSTNGHGGWSRFDPPENAEAPA